MTRPPLSLARLMLALALLSPLLAAALSRNTDPLPFAQVQPSHGATAIALLSDLPLQPVQYGRTN